MPLINLIQKNAFNQYFNYYGLSIFVVYKKNHTYILYICDPNLI